LGRNWQLGVSDYPLITSDRPVTTDIEIRGVRDTSSLSKAIISMPLCPELILVGVPNNDRVFHVMNTRTISETIATIANVGIFLRANRFLIADSSAPFRSLFDKFSSD